MKSFVGKIAICAVALVAALALLEWGATRLYRHVRGAAFSKQEIQAQLAAAGASEDFVVTGAGAPRFVQNKALHPYLGYVIDREPDSSTVNRFGFRGPSPLRNKQNGELVVAVFGGSVAMSIPEEALARRLAKIHGESVTRVVLLNLALSGYKQPQQLLALSYFLALGAEIDVAINLDGFNEVVLPFSENLPAQVDPSFPRLWQLHSRSGFDRRAVSIYARIEEARRTRARWSRRLAGSVLRSSSFALVAWDSFDLRWQHEIAVANAELKRILQNEEPEFQATGPLLPASRAEALVPAAIQLWSDSSRQMDRLCRANGIRYFHFLQPNQYVEGTKPLAEVEERMAIAPGANQDWVRRGYPGLIEAGYDLAAEGVAFTDLTRVFANETRAIYVDSCCHVNALGYELMIEAMGQAIEREGSSRRPPATPGRAEARESRRSWRMPEPG